MQVATIAGLLGVALFAILVGPTMPAPHPLAEADARASPEPNCMLNSMGIDEKKLGGYLNVMLSLVIQLLYNGHDECQQKDLMDKMNCTMNNMQEFMENQSPEGQGLLEALLGPLLDQVGELLKALLGSNGLTEEVSKLLNQILQFVLCLLRGLGLDIDVNVMVKLGKILSVDLGVVLG